MSNIWEYEYLRQKKLQEDAVKANESRQRSINKNLRMFDGRDFLTQFPKSEGPRIPNSTTFNPYTPYGPTLNPSTRLKDEVAEILRRQDLLEARGKTWSDNGPQTLDSRVEWLKKQGLFKEAADLEFNSRKSYPTVFGETPQETRNRQESTKAQNRLDVELGRKVNGPGFEMTRSEYPSKPQLFLPGTAEGVADPNAPMRQKQRQFDATDFGADSTIARLRRQANQEKIPTWSSVGPQTVDDYVEWLKKQGRTKEAYDIEWENRKPYQQPTGETKVQEINRLRSERADYDAKIRSGNWIKVGDILLELTPGEKLAKDLISKREIDDANWKNGFNRKAALNNGFNPDLSNFDRDALGRAERQFKNESTTAKIPDLSTDKNTPGLNRLPRDRNAENNIVRAPNRFTREPLNPVDPYSNGGGTGTLTRNGNPRSPNGGGFLFDDSNEASIRRQIIQNSLPLIVSGSTGIRANYERFDEENRAIERPKNVSLPGGEEPLRRTLKPESGSSATPWDGTNGKRPRSTGSGNNVPSSGSLGRRFALGSSPYGSGPGSMIAGDLTQTISNGVMNRAEERARLEAGGELVWRNLSKKEQSRRFWDAHHEEMKNLFQPWKWQFPEFSPKIYHPDGTEYKRPGLYDGVSERYWDKEQRIQDDRARRNVGSYYGPGLGDKLLELGRKISSDYYNDYKRILRNEKRRQQLEKDESRKNRKYWDDLDRNPNKQSLQRSLDWESERNLRDYEEEDKLLESERERMRDPFRVQRENDLQKTIEWNKANPQRETFQDKQRRWALEYWQQNDPSRIENKYNPWKSVPLPDPDHDPEYPPLPPGLKYPIVGWKIEAYSTPRPDGLTVPIYWDSTYFRDSSWVGDAPVPTVNNYEGNSIILNPGLWQWGRVGFAVMRSGRFASPPQYVGGDEREVLTEAEGRAKWGEAWDYTLDDSRWTDSPFRAKKKEILEDFRRVPYKGYSNFVPGNTVITKATPIRGKQPVPDPRPQNPPKPEPEDPIMPGCSYQPDKQNPATVSWWDKLTNSIKKKPISVHEGVDEGFEHISLQMAQLQEQINKISQVLDVDKYTSPQGKVVAPVLGMQAVTTVLDATGKLAPIPFVKTLPQENLIFAAVAHMFSGHHLLGKMQLPIDPNKGADMHGNIQRVTPLTSMGYMHQMYNNLSGMIGMPSSHSVVDANGVKTPLQFRNQSDATENVHNNTVQIQQDISSLQEAVFKILQNQETIINMNHKIGYQAQFLMDDTGARVKNIMVQRPTVMKHGKKPDPLSPNGSAREFNWGTVFTMGTAATSVPTWDKSNELDKMQLGLKTNIEAQKSAASNFYPISAKEDKHAIPSLRSKRGETWEPFVKTINEGSEGKIYHGIAVPESRIEYINGGVKQQIPTGNKPFIDGREIE